MYTKNDLLRQIKEMGIESNRTVLIHTSMKAIGEVEGGADAVIDAFAEYLKEGLFLIPTHTWNLASEKQPVYDVRSTQPCIGLIPKLAIHRAEGFRSLHPTHSVMAFGKRAEEYIKGEEQAESPTPPDGCWGRLYQEDALILLIGVTQNRNTYLHSVDEMLELPDRLSSLKKSFAVIDRGGEEHECSIRLHLNSHTDDISQFYPVYEPAFVHTGAVTFGRFGAAKVQICGARKCADTARLLWQEADHDLCISHEPIPEEYLKVLEPAR